MRSPRRWRVVSAGMLVGLSLLSGCAQVSATLDRPATSSSAQSAPGPYARAAYGPRWADIDRNGCKTRDDVLYREMLTDHPYRVMTKRGCQHDVVNGSWRDPYSGRLLTADLARDPQSVQIDHIVSLKESWISGAWRWSPAERRAFANDPANLHAVDGHLNQSKGEDDAATWKPAPAYQCRNAREILMIKTRYQLSIDPAEQRALNQMLTTCRAERRDP